MPKCDTIRPRTITVAQMINIPYAFPANSNVPFKFPAFGFLVLCDVLLTFCADRHHMLWVGQCSLVPQGLNGSIPRRNVTR